MADSRTHTHTFRFLRQSPKGPFTTTSFCNLLLLTALQKNKKQKNKRKKKESKEVAFYAARSLLYSVGPIALDAPREREREAPCSRVCFIDIKYTTLHTIHTRSIPIFPFLYTRSKDAKGSKKKTKKKKHKRKRETTSASFRIFYIASTRK